MKNRTGTGQGYEMQITGLNMLAECKEMKFSDYWTSNVVWPVEVNDSVTFLVLNSNAICCNIIFTKIQHLQKKYF
jgi:hypothetical protein